MCSTLKKFTDSRKRFFKYTFFRSPIPVNMTIRLIRIVRIIAPVPEFLSGGEFIINATYLPWQIKCI